MARFNKELEWLATTFNIDLSSMTGNGHISGALFSRITGLQNALLSRLRPDERFFCFSECVLDGTVIPAKTTVNFVWFNSFDSEVQFLFDKRLFTSNSFEFFKHFRLVDEV